MNILSQLTNWMASRRGAEWYYRRGMKRAHLKNHAAAIEDYTEAIDRKDAPADVRAMSLYNRALVYDAMNNRSKAISDLARVLEMPQASGNVKTEARRKLVRMQRNDDRTIP